MEAINLSQVSQKNFTNKQEVQKETSKAPEQKKNGKKLLAAGAAAVATIAIAALAIKKGKLPKATQVADLKFDKGIAMKGDEFFTGVAEYTNKKGDKFLLEYKDGVLEKSMKNINPETGAGSLKKGNFIKHYSEADGTRKVSISKDTINGVQRSNCEISKDSVIKTKITGEKEAFYFNDGKLSKYTSSDGTKRFWYDNGQMSKEYLPNRTLRKWYANGQMSKESLPDTTLREWYDNGQMSKEYLPNRPKRFWYKNGQMSEESSSDGTIRQWFDNGKMSFEYLPDTTLRQWYPNGQMRSERLPDGTLRQWHDNGQIVSQCKQIMLEGYNEPVKFEITYDESGRIKSLTNKKDNQLIADRRDKGYSCVTDKYNKESLKEIFDKLGIEMPDIKFE